MVNFQPSLAFGSRWGPCSCCQAVLPTEMLEAAEKEWIQHVAALKPSPLHDVMALAMYEGLMESLKESPTSAPAEDGHWISAKLARIAAAALLKKGDKEGAVAAARRSKRFAQSTLGPVASLVGAEATAIEAEVAAAEGQQVKAAQLYADALKEASALPRSAEGLAREIKEKLAELQEAKVLVDAN